MENKTMLKNLSKRCLIAIMSATVMMSSVGASLIFPASVYAVDYITTNDVPTDESGNRNLTSNDTLTTNDGTINQNCGTIYENNGTVNDNYGTVSDTSGASGTVVTNHTGGTVTGGNVTNNYASVTNAAVTNNYASGTVTGSSSTITNNYGTATDIDTVTNNCGTVTGTSTNVDHNYAGGTVNGTQGENQGPSPAVGMASDPAPNPQSAQPAPSTNSGPSEDNSVFSSETSEYVAPTTPANNVKSKKLSDEEYKKAIESLSNYIEEDLSIFSFGYLKTVFGKCSAETYSRALKDYVDLIQNENLIKQFNFSTEERRAIASEDAIECIISKTASQNPNSIDPNHTSYLEYLIRALYPRYYVQGNSGIETFINTFLINDIYVNAYDMYKESMNESMASANARLYSRAYIDYVVDHADFKPEDADAAAKKAVEDAARAAQKELEELAKTAKEYSTATDTGYPAYSNGVGAAAAQQTEAAQLAAVQTAIASVPTILASNNDAYSSTGMPLNMTSVSTLDASTAALLAANNKIPYNVTITFNGAPMTVKIPAGFNYAQYIKPDGSMNIHEVLWAVYSNQLR